MIKTQYILKTVYDVFRFTECTINKCNFKLSILFMYLLHPTCVYQLFVIPASRKIF